MLTEKANAAGIDLAEMTGAWYSLDRRWGLTWRERRTLFPKGGEDRADPCEDTMTRMRVLVEIGHRLRFESRDDEQDWLRLPLEMLGWHTPMEIMSGPLADLRRFRAFVEQGLGG